MNLKALFQIVLRNKMISTYIKKLKYYYIIKFTFSSLILNITSDKNKKG